MPAPSVFRNPDIAFARLGGIDGLRRTAEVAIVVLLAIQAARLAWLLLPPAALGSIATDAGEPILSHPDRLAIDAFYPDSGPTLAVADVSGLRLFAVRPSASGGSAIVSQREAAQRSHAVGGELAPGVVLAEVHADHVVLDTGGQRTELRFPATGARAPATAAVAASRPMPARTGGEAPDATIDPVQLLAQTGLAPVESGGRVTGYTMIPRGDGAVLRQAGLQAGDVLLSVNGQALTPERHAALADDLAGASTISLTYRRDGQVRTATLQAHTP